MRIRTVLGDIAPGDLGVCDAHDHLFIRSPRLPGEELDDPAAAAAQLRAFARLGGGAVAQWTPHGMGRRIDDLADVSRATGVHVIAATGLHHAAHYDADLLERLQPDTLFADELTRGRAGMIKVATAFHGLDAHARRVMTAAAAASNATGAPIGVHLEQGTSALDVLDLLCGALGVPPDRVILGHLNRSPDSWVHRRAAESGAYLAFDGPSRTHHATDWHLFASLAALAEAGHTDRLLLGGDTTTASARAELGIPHVLRALRPRVERQLGREAATAIFTTNPARAFAAPWP
ncbi:phosphotriesterase-related protein [Actinomadura luteofluorescens]|uniref:Phosphotriesterase-related protein n=1 Tax=Actinomadura luteofluorescens TaxID=46163 RepID=A0A7Y9JI92_9ACTN|nr:phosphotriesterase [Actinomadura luteofluorescens]NYD48174.1 phosphotriesterase-related protein [Actinomadura luteofluorescens]